AAPAVVACPIVSCLTTCGSSDGTPSTKYYSNNSSNSNNNSNDNNSNNNSSSSSCTHNHFTHCIRKLPSNYYMCNPLTYYNIKVPSSTNNSNNYNNSNNHTGGSSSSRLRT
ncbi:unnamed protein product, partial [Polarella glacialis]